MTRALAAAALALGALSCGDLDPGAPLTVGVHVEHGSLPETYRVVYMSDAGDVSALTCPASGADAVLACNESRVELDRAALPGTLTVKTRGHTFQSVSLPVQPQGAVSVTLAPLAAFETRLSEGLVWVAETDEGEMAAFGQLHPRDCVELLYCAAPFARRGYATALFRELELAASAQNVEILKTAASRIARPFFERQGFVTEATEHVVRHGTPLERYRMSKALTRASLP